jgi:hypothetical protein
VFAADADVVMVRVPYGYPDVTLTYGVVVDFADPIGPAAVSGLPSAGVHRPSASERPNTKIGGRSALVDGGLNATIFGIGSGLAADGAASPPLDAKAIAAAVTLIGDPSKPGTDDPLR